jgi:hypothetical protein
MKYSTLFTTHKFAVAVLDRYGNEYTPTFLTTTTSTETTHENLNIRIISNGIQVHLNSLSTLELYSISGLLIYKNVMMGDYSSKLNRGVYILRVNGNSYKIVF